MDQGVSLWPLVLTELRSKLVCERRYSAIISVGIVSAPKADCQYVLHRFRVPVAESARTVSCFSHHLFSHSRFLQLLYYFVNSTDV